MKGLRVYHLVGFEYDNTLNIEVDLQDLFCPRKDDSEVIYTLCEELPRILDMNVGELLYVNTNRGIAECKGVLKRIK